MDLYGNSSTGIRSPPRRRHCRRRRGAVLSDAELLAKQAWWARGCNWTAPAGGGEKKSWIERQRERLDHKIKRHKAEHPDESFAACAFWILLYIAAIMCAIKGRDPPAGQPATRRAA